MVALPQPLDPSKIEKDERSGFEPIPAGKYKLQVIDSSIADTSTGSGQMLTLTMEVVEGPYERRRLWDRLNIVNQSADAQRIALSSFKILCESMGIKGPVTDTEVLHFKPFDARVTITVDRTGQYGPQNKVNYIDPNAQRPAAGKAQPQGAAPRSAAKPATNAGAKPWQNPQAAKAAADPDDGVPF